MTEKEFILEYKTRLNDKADEYIKELRDKSTSSLEEEVALRHQNLSEYCKTLIIEIINENNIDAFDEVLSYSGYHKIPYGMRLYEISIESQFEVVNKFNHLCSSL